MLTLLHFFLALLHRVLKRKDLDAILYVMEVIEMITAISKRVVSFFIQNGIVKKDDQEVYSYSFEILLATIINFFTII